MTEPKIKINVPEAYLSQFMDELDRLRETVSDPEAIEDYVKDNPAVLNLFHVDPLSNPNDFLEAKKQFLETLQGILTYELPNIKKRMANGVTAFLGLEGEAAANFLSELEKRSLGTVEVVVVDDAAKNARAARASFMRFQRQILLHGSPILRLLEDHKFESPEFKQMVIDDMISHEVLHSMMIAAVQETSLSELHNVRNGIRVTEIRNAMDPENYIGFTYANWISEALLETVRRQVTGFDIGSYSPGVVVLELAEELDPGITQLAAEVAFAGKPPSVLFGRLENLFGPSAIDDLDEAIFIAELDGLAAFVQDVKALVAPQHKFEAGITLNNSISNHSASLKGFSR